jgi:parallel beta-helix repeat protein
LWELADSKTIIRLDKRHGGKVMKKIISLVLMQMVMIAVLAATQPASVSAREMELTVGPDQEYETIQAAVDAAQQGSRIFVYSRSSEDPEQYAESVTITTNNLQIIAQGSDVTVTPPEGKPGFDVNADHVTVRGFEISGAYIAGITFQGSHNTFAENNIHGFVGPLNTTAIHCDDYNGGSDYNTIESNSLSGADGTGVNYGIVVSAASDALNEGNVIKNNTIEDVAITCIYVGNGKGFRISGNTIQYCREGIVLEAGSGAVLTHNHVVSNTIGLTSSDGIRLSAGPGAIASNNLLLGNLVYHNAANGISLSAGSDYNRIQNNEVQTGDVGIAVAGDNNLIAHNYFYLHDTERDDTGVGNRWRNNSYVAPWE